MGGMRSARACFMHSAPFAIKLAHLSFLRFSRRETKEVGLTPARLDMLRAILEQPGHRVLQRDLQRLLGVCNSVVCVMIQSLEKLEFLTRSRTPKDRRTFVITLTPKARFALRRIHYSSVIEGFLELALVSALFKDRMPRAGLWRILSRLEQRLSGFRTAFGIGWTTYNPWHANDDDDTFYYAPVPHNPNCVGLAPPRDWLGPLDPSTGEPLEHEPPQAEIDDAA